MFYGRSESVYKSVSFFFQQLIRSVLSVGKVIFLARYKASLPKASADSCCILGNGPSLKESIRDHASFFNEKELFCVNNFSVSAEYAQLKPAAYVLLDPAYGIYDPVSKNLPHVREAFEALVSKTAWNVDLYIPSFAAKSAFIKSIPSRNSLIRVIYYNYVPYTGFESIGHWLYRRNLAAPQCQNILNACIFLALNRGFKKIYLFGADHSWHEQLHLDEEGELCLKDFHFYDQPEKVVYQKFYKNDKKEVFTMAEIFATWAKVFRGYEALQRYALTLNARVYNASTKTFIDSFKRIKL